MDNNKILIIFLVAVILIILFRTNITVIKPIPNPVPYPVPVVVKPIGGCAGTRYGCCPNGITARMNPAGTNC